MFEFLQDIDGISDELRRTDDLKPGDRFFKCALQVNPYGYAVRHPKGEAGPSSQVEYDVVMVAAAPDAGATRKSLTG